MAKASVDQLASRGGDPVAGPGILEPAGPCRGAYSFPNSRVYGYPVCVLFAFHDDRLYSVSLFPLLGGEDQAAWIAGIRKTLSAQLGAPALSLSGYKAEWSVGDVRAFQMGRQLSFEHCGLGRAAEARLALLSSLNAPRRRRPEELSGTASASWANSGWGRFRWGMGPRDVANHLGKGEFLTEAAREDERRFWYEPSQQIYGARVRVDFFFSEKRLVSLQVQEVLAEAASTVLAVRDGLTTKYGTPTCGLVHGSGDLNECHWNVSRALRIRLEWAGALGYQLTYERPGGAPKEVEKL